MCVQRRIDDLIKAGWGVLESNFHPAAFHNWRREAFFCLNVLLGPDHAYTDYFRSYVQEAEKKNLLVGGGILTAAKEKMVRMCQEAHERENQANFLPHNCTESCESSYTVSVDNLSVYEGLPRGFGNVQPENKDFSEPESQKRGRGISQ
jgi:hypothetical protein